MKEPCEIALNTIANNEFGYFKFQEFILDDEMDDESRVRGFEIWKKQKKEKDCTEEDKTWLIQNRNQMEILINVKINVDRICS